MKLIIIFISLFLIGCSDEKGFIEPPERWATDQELRVELFHACLERLPKAPHQTTYSDWDEVVDSCEAAAYRQSRFCYENCEKGSYKGRAK